MDFSRYYVLPDEKPLDRMVTNGGFCSIFRTIACVGDSLSSGEFEATGDQGQRLYPDMFEYSWGQHIARMTGCTVYNFSRGGMTAREYCNSFAEQKGYWNPSLACQAYILALGVNDVVNHTTFPMGSLADVCDHDSSQNQPTFAGYYAQIIQRYREIQPQAKFFLMTMPSLSDDTPTIRARRTEHAALLHAFAAHFSNTYVIDLHRDLPVYDETFRKTFFLGGHMNACGYSLTAEIVASLSLIHI